MKKEKNNDQIQEFWQEAKENIEEGARTIGDEARDIGEKIYSYSEVVFGKIKEGTSDLWKSGVDLTNDMVNRAQEVAEKYRDRIEVRKLNEEKKKVASQLGMNVYLEVKNNDNTLPEKFFTKRQVKSMMKNLEQIDKQILDLSEEEK
jgi:hypothetical protein